MVASDIVAINDISYGLFILLFALFAAEILFAVSLCVVEDFNDADLENISDKLNLKNIEALEKFLRNRHKFENRFHCALITVNILMFYPFIKISAFLVDLIFKDINLLLLAVISVVFFSIYLFINYLLFFALPRKVVRHSSEYTKAMFTLFSLKISIVMAPIADFSDILLRGFFKLIGKNSFNAKEEVTEDDILSMVQESKDMGLIEDDEVAMINNIFELNDKEAKDIMTNRKNIVAIDANTPLPDAIKMMLEGSNSRYPVYIDNLDHIIGILHLKDALRYQDANKQRNGAIKRYPKLLREARFVLETRKIDDLFKKMKDDKLQMVIVIDEYGQTSGLVAMEDILEEIVGNILDEYDEEETFVEVKDGKSYEIDGLTPLEDLESLLKIKLECEDNDIETINGYILNKLGYIPAEGEECEIEAEGYIFKVLSVEKHIIKSVLVTKIVNEITNNSDTENSSKDTENIEKKQQ
ncbi:MAG: HlyC/CorC family transporter [Lachnospiraceae bacterium]|nr:HlyC/CorC family transporter [Lachnospiraceae bacterium]